MVLTERKKTGAWALTACLALSMVTGCATHRLANHAELEYVRGNYDQAVLAYAKLSASQPEKNRWLIALSRSKMKASQAHFIKARKYNEAGQNELAIGELQQVVTLDPTNSYAQTELEKALLNYQKARAEASLTELELMKEQARRSAGAPLLDARSNIPVMLQFRDVEIGKIYEALSKATGINFLYDPKLDTKRKTTIELTNVPFEKAMDTLMFTNKHFFKVMDENTILIADDNQQKRREYEDEVIKTFFLSNADVKDVQSLLRTMLDARKLVQNNQLNAITIRDTPNKVAIAEKIIQANDKAKAELMIDVELLEVSRTISRTLGINLSQKQFSLGFTGPDRLPLNNLGLLTQRGLWSFGPIPNVTLDLLRSDSGTRTIAKPQLRVTEGEKANLHIGDSVPIPTTTFNTTGTVGGSVVPITSFTYQEVGIVIEIEPRVHHNKEVTLKLNVEVSQLGERVDAGQGVSQPSINTRQINTIIRLRDGEANLLAGLIRDDGTSGKSALWPLPSTSINDTRRETDLVLTLTPRIIRIPDIRQEDLDAFFIGNEANPHLRGQANSVFATPFTTRLEGEDEDEGDGLAAQEEASEVLSEAAPAAVPSSQGAAKPPGATGATPTQTPSATKPATAGQTPPGTEPEDDSEEEMDDEEPVVEPIAPPPAPAQQNPPAATPTQQPATPMNLTIAPARLTVAAGGSFSVNMLVNNVVNMQKISFVLTYDPTTIEFDSGLEGIIMKQDGTQTIFSATKAAEGQVAVEVSRLGGLQGISRGGALAALRFKALAAGKSPIAFGSIHAETHDGANINVSAAEAEITVSN